jgi:hypothetical protein
MAYFGNKILKEAAREVKEISGYEWKASLFSPHFRLFALLHDFAFLLLLTNNSVSGVMQSPSTRSTCHSIHLISSVQFLNYYPAAVLCFPRNSMTSTSTSIILLLLSYLFELLNLPSLSWRNISAVALCCTVSTYFTIVLHKVAIDGQRFRWLHELVVWYFLWTFSSSDSPNCFAFFNIRNIFPWIEKSNKNSDIQVVFF